MGFELNMSTDEGPELRELVAQTLENNGVLSKIRAELRASVFLALEEQEPFQDKIPFINKSLKDFLKTSEGSLVACLVREFLEFFELDFTLSVFDPETYHGKDYDYCGRNKLISDLQIKNVNERKAPLLSHILQLVRTHFANEGSAPTVEEQGNENISSDVVKGKKSAVLNQTYSADEAPSNSEGPVKKSQPSALPVEDSSSSKSAALTSSVFDFPLPKKSSSVSEVKETIKKSSEVAKGVEVPGGKPGSSFLSSLGNLPPLSGMPKAAEKLVTPGDVKDTGQRKPVTMDTVLEGYDEDFQSSASGEGRNTVAGSSDTEIEEDIGSGVDDLLSSASAAEDLTVDVTASKASGIGDYMENL